MGFVRLATGVYIPNGDMAYKSDGQGQAGLPDGWSQGYVDAQCPIYWDSMFFGGYRSPGVVQPSSHPYGQGRSLRVVLPTGKDTDYTRYVQSPRSIPGEFFGADQMAPGNFFQDYFKYQVMFRLRGIPSAAYPAKPFIGPGTLQTQVLIGDAMPKTVTLSFDPAGMATNAIVKIDNELFLADTPNSGAKTIRLTARAQQSSSAATHSVSAATTLFNWYTNLYGALTVVDASSGRTKEICAAYFDHLSGGAGWLTASSAISTLDNTGWTGSGSMNPSYAYWRLYLAANTGPQSVYMDWSVADVVVFTISPVDLGSEPSTLTAGQNYYELSRGVQYDDGMSAPMVERADKLERRPSMGARLSNRAGNIKKRKWRFPYRNLQATDYDKLWRMQQACQGTTWDAGSNVGSALTGVLIPNMGNLPGMDHAYYVRYKIDAQQFDGSQVTGAHASMVYQGGFEAWEM